MFKANIYWLVSLKRWWAIPAVSLVLTINARMNASTLSVLSHAPVNQWDVLLGVFNDPFTVELFIPALFFLLTADLLWGTNASYTCLFVTRCGTQGRWLVGKVWTVGVCALLYVWTLFLTSLIISVIVSPRGWTWSMADDVLRFHFVSGLAPHDLTMRPPWAFLLMLCLMFWGLFASGSLVAVVSYAVKMPFAGIVLGVVLSALSMISPTKWFPTSQMELNAHRGFGPGFAAGYPTLLWSFLYLALVLLVSGAAGWVMTWFRDA